MKTCAQCGVDISGTTRKYCVNCSRIRKNARSALWRSENEGYHNACCRANHLKRLQADPNYYRDNARRWRERQKEAERK